MNKVHEKIVHPWLRDLFPLKKCSYPIDLGEGKTPFSLTVLIFVWQV